MRNPAGSNCTLARTSFLALPNKHVSHMNLKDIILASRYCILRKNIYGFGSDMLLSKKSPSGSNKSPVSSRGFRCFGTQADVEPSTSDGLTVEGIVATRWTILDESESENDWKSDATAVAQSIQVIKKRLQWKKSMTRLNLLSAELNKPNLWDDPVHAGKISCDLVMGKMKEVKAFEQELLEHNDMIKLAREENDTELESESLKALLRMRRNSKEKELEVLVSGEPAGAGGTESMDWTSTIMQMYKLWAQQHGYGVTLMDEMPSEVAGIKRATVNGNDEYAFGYSKGEVGVHRLVHISPFDSGKCRHTSFAAVAVKPLTFFGKYLHGNIFARNKQGLRLFSSADSTIENITIIQELIRKQRWSEVKTHLRITNSRTLLQQLFNSETDPEIILRYFCWSRKELKISHSLELTCRLLHLLAAAKKYSKLRSFLHGFVKNESFLSVPSIFHAVLLSSHSLCHNSIIVDMLILAYLRNMKLHLGLEAFRRAGDYGLRLSVLSCNQLLSLLVKESKFEDVEHMYREMRKRRINFNIVSFNIVINGLCKVGKLNKANDVLEDMKLLGVLPNVVTYNTLIDGYCKKGKIGKMYKADAILKEMVENGICPNGITFNILIDGFCKDDNLSAAMKVFEEMKSQGVMAGVVTYNSLINGLCHHGKLDEAIGLRQEMLRLGLKPNAVTYNALINGFSKNKMLDKARELFDDISKQGMVPSPITYSTVIDAYCKDGRMEDAFALHSSMLDRGVLPCISTYNCLIGGLCRNGNIEGARKLANELVNKGLRADLVTYNILIGALCKEGNPKNAAELLDEMFKVGLSPSHVTYNTLMDGYCREGNLVAALNLRRQMEKEKKRPNIVTYNVLINGFCQKGKLEDANMLLNELLEKGMIPNQTTYEIVREEMLEKGFVPDIEGHLYNFSGSS